MLNKLTELSKKTKKKLGVAKANEGQFVIGLDIGTEFVKALVARVKREELEIIGVGRKHQEFSDMQAGAIADIGAVVANCDAALAQAEQQAGVNARTAVLGIAGELVKGTTTTIRCTRKNAGKPLDMQELEQIIGLVQGRAEKKAKQELAWEMGGKEVEIRLVNSALVGIDIDGYKVTNPIGFPGKDVIVQLYTAFAPLVHIGALERTAQELDLNLTAVAAEPFAVARSVVGNDPNASISAILMDVGGGTTDIAVVNDGGVQGTKSFGIGGRAFTRTLERELSIDFVQAEKLKLELGTGKLPQNKKAAIEKILSRTVDVWVNGVELALSEFTKLDYLPNRIFLCGGGSSLELLVNSLNADDWHKDLPFSRKLVIQHIKPQQAVGIIDKTDEVTDHTFATAMGLLRVGLDTLQQDSKPAHSVKEKIDKMLRI